MSRPISSIIKVFRLKKNHFKSKKANFEQKIFRFPQTQLKTAQKILKKSSEIQFFMDCEKSLAADFQFVPDGCARATLVIIGVALQL